MPVPSVPSDTDILELNEKWKAAKAAMDSACSIVSRKMSQTFGLPPGQHNNPTEEEMAKCDAARNAFEEIDRQLTEIRAAVRQSQT